MFLISLLFDAASTCPHVTHPATKR